MYPPPFDYQRPSTLGEALAVLAESGAAASVLAGGTGLLPLLKLRQARPDLLVDVQDVAELGGEVGVNGTVSLPALTTHGRIAGSPSIPPALHALVEAAAAIGDPQVRNMGTVGGALAEANPLGDWPATLLALRARAALVSAAGEREVAVDDLLLDGGSGLRPGELVRTVLVDVPPPGSGSAHVKLERRSGVGVVCAAVSLALDGDGTCTSASVGLTGVGDRPVRAAAAEEHLVGRVLGEAALAEAAAAAGSDVSGPEDIRGSADYRRSAALALVRRACAAAWERAGEDRE